MNPTSLSFCLSYSSTLTLMKLFLLPSGSISMHQREEPANTLYAFMGTYHSAYFFNSYRFPAPCFLQYSRISVNSVVPQVPDASKITRFKQDFLEDLQAVFKHLVDLTEPICQAIDSASSYDHL